MTRAPAGHTQERGFALLLIFLIAAAVAFTMYQEMPRAAFESARDKEQLLMDRGNQYKRAIQVFYAVNKRYPAEIKDLENTNNKRFLRRRYVDPMTGQDEWRLIHTNGSFLTDSRVEKPPAQNANNRAPGAGQMPGGGPLGANNMNTALPANVPPTVNDPAINLAAVQNPAALRRPSDRGFAAGPRFPQSGFNPANPNGGGASPFAAYPPGVNPAGAFPSNFDADDPRTWPAITLAPATPQPGQQQAQPGQPQAGPPPPGFGQPQPNAQITRALQPSPQPSFYPQGGVAQPEAITQALPQGQPLQFQPQVVQPQAGQLQSNIPGQLPGEGGANPQPTALINPQIDNPNPFGHPPEQAAPKPTNNATRQDNLPGFNPQNPAAIGQASSAPPANSGNAALNAIDAALFRPNQAPASAGPTGSPGIAGVASKFEGASIKAYRERTKYQEWEFVFEPASNPPPGQTGAPALNPQQNLNGPGLNGSGLSGPGRNAPGQGTGMAPAGGAANPFSMPNPFSQQPATR